MLLTNIIDYLLGKADFEKALRREFDPTSKEITLQALAGHLRGSEGVDTVNNVTEFLIGFFRQKALPYSANDVLNTLIECGILVRADDDISFKYPRFQDYFYAGLMREDSAVFKEATAGTNFVKFHRELDLLSGLRRRNSDLIELLSTSLSKGPPAEFEAIPLQKFDELADQQSAIGISRKKLADIKQKKITADQIDDLMDAADRRAAEQAEKRNSDDAAKKTPLPAAEGELLPPVAPPMDFPTYTAALDLFGRVIRNSDFTDASEKLPAARLYLQSNARLYLMFVDVISDILDEALAPGSREGANSLNMNPEDIAAAKYTLNSIILLAVQDSTREQIGTEKMAVVYNEILKSNDCSNIERMLISLLMFDLHATGWKESMDKLIQVGSKQRFFLEFLIEKIWRTIHVRTVSDEDREKMADIASQIERHLGSGNQTKSAIQSQFKRIAAETSKRESS